MRRPSLRSTRWLVAAALLAATSACDVLSPDRWNERRDVLEYHRELWQSHAIGSYRFVHHEEGDTQRAAAGPVDVVVGDGVITNVEPLTVTGVTPQTEWYWTLDELFDFIDDAISRRPNQFQIVYHSVLGFPTFVNIQGGIADGHVTFWIDDFDIVQEQ
jgi:hypothetical protein